MQSTASTVAAPQTATTSSTTTTTTTVRYFSLPSWWSGKCDVYHWNRAAVAAGFRRPDHPTEPIQSAYAMSASYYGVPVCGPMPGSRVYYEGRYYTVPSVMWTMPNSWGYPEFYCTELAFRFMRQAYGVAPFAAAGGTVVQNYSTADGGGLVKYANVTRTYDGKAHPVPRPGDIVSFKAGSSASYYIRVYLGHVAVVASSSVSAYTGNGWLKLLTQNDTSSGWRWVPVYHFHIGGMGSGYAWLYAWGWLHDPKNRGV